MRCRLRSAGRRAVPRRLRLLKQPDGSTPLLPSTVTQTYRRLATHAGLRSTRIHALRRYSATELLSAGVDLRTVVGRLGHGSGGATTLRFYAASVEKVDRAAAGTIADLIPRPDPTHRAPRNPYEELDAVPRVAIERGELARLATADR
jgi:integrase